MSNCCSHGTFLHFSLQSSHLNILLLIPKSALETVQAKLTLTPSSLTSMPAYSSWLYFNHDGEVWASHFTIHFHSAGELFLSGFRLSWPPSCCLDELTLLWCVNEREFWCLNLTFSSSRITSFAYQKWPTRNSHSRP